MTATKINLQGLGPVRKRAATLLAWVSLLAPFAAHAQNVLQDIRFEPGANGAVDITLQLAAGAPDAQVFTTDEPPRIAVDLPDTRSEAPRRVAIGTGAASAVSAVEAAGRTRVVVELFRPASYETRMEGNNFVISVAGGSGTIAASPALISQDPAKQFSGVMSVSNVDFRRTAEGAGRVIVAFSGEGAPVDMRTESGRVIVEMPGVRVADEQVQQLDVVDFATPVKTITTSSTAGGGRLIVTGEGDFDSMAYQSGNEYVIEISPRAAAVPTVVGADGELPDGVYLGDPVTFNFQDIPVRTVLQLIAEESGLNIVAADTVSGNVTLRLINVPWDQALEIVLRAKGLDQRRDGNVVWVAPQSELASYERAQAEARVANEALAPLMTEYIQINYANAADIASLLTEDAKINQQAQAGGQQQIVGAQTRGFLSARGSVTFDARTNTILINDTAEKIIEVRRLVALLDRPVDQVLIEAKIVIASEEFARELGARFGVSGGYEDSNGNLITTTGTLGGADRMANLGLINRFNTSGATGLPVAAPGAGTSGISVPAIGDRLNVNLPVAGSTGSIGFAILGADYLLDLELSALETEGRGEVVSNPRVITANQREAVIRQGDEVGYVTIAPTAGTVPIPNVQFKEVLLQMTVTPTITKDGRVFLVLAVQKDDIEGFVETSIGDVPQIATREISTAVLVDNGQTVVVGGVYEFSSREDLAKVPFLGDIPVLGNLFKRKGRDISKAELLIFVTPKILNVPGRSE